MRVRTASGFTQTPFAMSFLLARMYGPCPAISVLQVLNNPEARERRAFRHKFSPMRRMEADFRERRFGISSPRSNDLSIDFISISFYHAPIGDACAQEPR